MSRSRARQSWWAARLVVAVTCLGSIPGHAQDRQVTDPVAAPVSAPADDDDDSTATVAPTAPGEATARTPWLRTQLQAALDGWRRTTTAHVGVAVVDLATDEVLFADGAERGMNLASTTKLLTSSAALAALGPSYRWRTSVHAVDFDLASGTVKGDLYLRGRGDPTLGHDDLATMARELRARGVRRIDGRLVIDATFFDDVVLPPHFAEQPKEQAGFRAGVAALDVDRGTITIVVTPDAAGQGLAEVRVVPATTSYVRVTSASVLSVPRGPNRIRVDMKEHDGRIDLALAGECRAEAGPGYLRRRVEDPLRLAEETFRRALADAGIRLRAGKPGEVARGQVPSLARVLVDHDSEALAVVLRQMAKASDNFVAETVLKTLGAETRPHPGPATWADGTAAVRAFLTGAGVSGSWRADNGSGLFGSTSVSAAQLVEVLRAAYHDYRIAPDFMAALPIGGADGTLARRLAEPWLRGRVRAKTGTLAEVVTLAGYAGVDGGRLLAFAVLINEIKPGGRPAARKLADQVAADLVAYLGGS